MANQHRHRQRVVRGIADDTWEQFTQLVGEKNRSAFLAAVVRWAIHEGDLPARPPKPEGRRGRTGDTPNPHDHDSD